MERAKKVFVFNTVWYKIIRNCSTLVKGEVFTAVMEYAETGKIIELSDEAYVIFQFIKREIDRRESRRTKSTKTAKVSAETKAHESTENNLEKTGMETTPAASDTNTEPTEIKQLSIVTPPDSLAIAPPVRLTRQMRRKLLRQGIDLKDYAANQC